MKAMAKLNTGFGGVMRLYLVYTVFLGILPLPSRAQRPAAKPPVQDEKPLVFTTGSRLVVVDVTVKDKSGNTINGLKISDFAVTEDGQKQKVEVFEPQVSDYGGGAAAGSEALR